MVRLRTKFLAAVPRTGGTSQPRSILPSYPVARYTGHAVVVSGLVGAAPLHPVSPLTAILESAPDNDVDLSQVKSALRFLYAVGDGVSGVPWLKGAAGLGLEIVNVLDNVQSNKSDCRDLALRICQFLIIMHQKSRPGYDEKSEPQHIIDFRSDLHRILRTVKTIASYRLYRRLLKADDIKQQILKCDRMLSHSRDIFLVRVHADLVPRSVKQMATAKVENSRPIYRISAQVFFLF